MIQNVNLTCSRQFRSIVRDPGPDNNMHRKKVVLTSSSLIMREFSKTTYTPPDPFRVYTPVASRSWSAAIDRRFLFLREEKKN